MSDGTPRRLCDHPEAVAALLPILEAMYPAANLSDPKAMMYEDKRLELAAIAGKHLVVQDFRNAIEQAKREKNKPKHRTEVV